LAGQPDIVPESRALARIRTYLLYTLAAGSAGTAIELLLLGHFEELYQVSPIVLLTAGFLLVCGHALRPSGGSVTALQIVMALFVVNGAVGVGLHYRGNSEFEREMYPTMAGLELVRNTMTGATPVLAPGTMTLLGLIGLVHTYRHPRRRAGRGPDSKEMTP
jgi:hypothetical protein